MTSTNPDIEHRALRRRQREVAERACREATAGLTLGAGLPPAADADEMDEIVRGNADPAMHAMLLEELLAIARTAPGHGPTRSIGDSLAELGMTIDQAKALAEKRIREKLGQGSH